MCVGRTAQRVRRGLRILLLDDIVTTGATAVECAKVLYRNGADYVGCVSCATVD